MEKETQTMLIANPIYDVVFNYMLEDDKVAKLFLSALVGKEVLELTFMPQEVAVVKPTKKGEKPKSERRSMAEASGLSIYRLDFSARLKIPDGTEQVVILEVQKSKLRSDTIRFRTYLGKQYMNTNLVRWIASNQHHAHKAGIPIFPIFILGEGLEEYADIPVIQISNCVRDKHSSEQLGNESVFISAMFHEGLIVNVPALSQRRRNDLEKLLAVFDQSQVDESHHIMNIKEKDFDVRYRPIIRRLQQAASSGEVRDRMQDEDLFLSEFAEYERDLALMQMQKDEAQRREVVAQAEKKEAQKETEKLQRMVAKMLQEQGKAIDEIALIMGVDPDTVNRLLL